MLTSEDIDDKDICRDELCVQVQSMREISLSARNINNIVFVGSTRKEECDVDGPLSFLYTMHRTRCSLNWEHFDIRRYWLS